jgi:hypothetical protein
MGVLRPLRGGLRRHVRTGGRLCAAWARACSRAAVAKVDRGQHRGEVRLPCHQGVVLCVRPACQLSAGRIGAGHREAVCCQLCRAQDVPGDKSTWTSRPPCIAAPGWIAVCWRLQRQMPALAVSTRARPGRDRRSRALQRPAWQAMPKQRLRPEACKDSCAASGPQARWAAEQTGCSAGGQRLRGCAWLSLPSQKCRPQRR